MLMNGALVGLWIDAGSRFEDDKTNGVAHFKGTSKRSLQGKQDEWIV